MYIHASARASQVLVLLKRHVSGSFRELIIWNGRELYSVFFHWYLVHHYMTNTLFLLATLFEFATLDIIGPLHKTENTSQFKFIVKNRFSKQIKVILRTAITSSKDHRSVFNDEIIFYSISCMFWFENRQHIISATSII